MRSIRSLENLARLQGLRPLRCLNNNIYMLVLQCYNLILPSLFIKFIHASKSSIIIKKIIQNLKFSISLKRTCHGWTVIIGVSSGSLNRKQNVKISST